MKKDIIQTFGTRVISILLSFGNSIFLTRLLGVEGKGEMAIFIASLAFFVIFLGFSLQPAIVFYGSKKELDFTKLFNTIVVYAILIGGLFFFVMNLYQSNFDTSFFLHKNRSGIFYQVAFSISLVLTIIMNQTKAIFSAMKKFSYLNLFQLVSIILGLIFYSIMFFTNGKWMEFNFQNIFTVYCTIILLNFLITIAFFSRLCKLNPFKGFLSTTKLKLLFAFAGIAYIGSVAQYLNYRIDLWFVDYFTNVKELGLYSLAANLSQMLWILPQSIAFVLMPNVASGSKGILPKTLSVGRIVIFLCFIVAMLAIIVVPFAIPVLYGKSFSASSDIFLILLCGIIPYCLSVIYGSYFAGIKKLEYNMYSAIIGLIATLILDIYLIPKYGAIGAAIASSCSYLISTLYLIFKMNSLTGVTLSNLIVLNKEDVNVVRNALLKNK